MSKVLLHVRLDKDLHSWIKEEFPYGFMQMFYEECTLSLRRIIEEKNLPPLSDFGRMATILTMNKLTKESESETE